MSDEKHNGWTNWETWEAYNMLTSFEDTYAYAREFKSNPKALRMLTIAALEKCGCFENHIAWEKVNWREIKIQLAEHLEGK